MEQRIVDIAPVLERMGENFDESNKWGDYCEAEETLKAMKRLQSLPIIDPESLRQESEWELNPGRCTCEHFRCKKCRFINCVAVKYCGECGAKMKNAGVKPEDLPLPPFDEENRNEGYSGWEEQNAEEKAD